MQYQVTRLDRRFSHKGSFDYMVEFSKIGRGTGVLDFDRARRWMNRTYGWSQEVETRSAIEYIADAVTQSEDINQHWAYSISYRDYRIYLRGQKELAFFQLAHSGTK